MGSVAFPGKDDSTNEVPIATPLSRPPHLPFRRMSLPSNHNVNGFANNRFSIASTTSLESTGTEGQSTSVVISDISKPAMPLRNRRPHTSSNYRPQRETTVFNREMNAKRQKIVNEIVDTEQAYVNGLDLVYTNFLTPLMESLETPHPILSRSDITTLFSNFIDIWNFHRSFLASLTNLLASTTDTPTLSPLLMSHFPYLSLYTPFVTSFPTALTNLPQLMASNPSFSDFIRRQEADPRCGKLTLRDWLLTIVQRCPRYLLLLKDLISCTDPSDPEHQALVQVHVILSKITQSLNTSLRIHSQTVGLLALQRATVNLPFQFVQPGRTLIRRGSLLQGQAEKNPPASREFLLFSDYLVWLSQGDERLRRPILHRGRYRSETELSNSTSKDKHVSLVSEEERWTCKGYIALVDVEVVITPSGQDGSERARFDVLSPQGSFAVYAATEDEREIWVTDIRNAKANLLASLSMMNTNSTLTSSQSTTHLRRVLQALPDERDSTTHKRGRVDHFLPAIWVPDYKTNNCMRCNVKFNWRKRRHHCRLCGRCVCADCSTKTFIISDTSTKDTKRARSCNVCYETVFPVLQDSSDPTRQNHVEEEEEEPRNVEEEDRPLNSMESVSSSTDTPDSDSTLGTLPKLLGAQPVLNSNGVVIRRSPSALLKPGFLHDSSFWNAPSSSRPLSQPAMMVTPRHSNNNNNDFDVASDPFHVSSFSDHIGLRSASSSSPFISPRPSMPPLRHQFSGAALAVTAETVTTTPVSPNGRKGRRFSLGLDGKKISQEEDANKSNEHDHQPEEEHGPALGRLEDILSKEQRQRDLLSNYSR